MQCIKWHAISLNNHAYNGSFLSIINIEGRALDNVKEDNFKVYN